MSRKSGCPFTVKDYSIEIKNQVTSEYVRVKGLDSMSVDTDAETDDGMAGDAFWSEMFIKSRSVSGSVEGRPISDRTTGVRDPGQALMHQAAYNEGGCDNDQTLRVADAVGHAVEYDCVITKESRGSDEDGETVSWDWEGVGKPREIPYVQASAVGFKSTGDTPSAITTLSVAVDATQTVAVDFTPANASNKRYTFYMADESVATINAIDGTTISIQGVSAGSTTLTVKSMNNALTAELTITVTAP